MLAATPTIFAGAVTPTITLYPDTGVATTIQGSGFAPWQNIKIYWNDTQMVTLPYGAMLFAGPSGNFVAMITALNQTANVYEITAVNTYSNSTVCTASANFTVPIAQDPDFHIIFLSSYLKKLWMKHHRSGSAPFHCICSANPCSIRELLKAFNISNSEDMQLFSQRTDYCLNDYLTNCGGLIKLSGVTSPTSKSRKSSKSGRTSRSASLKKGRTCHGQDGK
jgi:hypothetical protein